MSYIIDVRQIQRDGLEAPGVPNKQQIFAVNAGTDKFDALVQERKMRTFVREMKEEAEVKKRKAEKLKKAQAAKALHLKMTQL